MDPTFGANESSGSRPMIGGDGPKSYAQNSIYQREVINFAKDAITEAISKTIDVNKPQFDPSNPFRIADLGCSTGPNTIIAMQNIIEAVELKYKTIYNSSTALEFQVFFNDHTDNDFNTLFRNLATSWKNFASGVPGSFYGRLFPRKSLQIAHSSYALHWLSKVPNEVKDKSSHAYNRNKIYCSGDNELVTRAYVSQFERDMGSFLEARAKELVEGGLLIIKMPGGTSFCDGVISQVELMHDLLEESLYDLAKMGFITEEKVHSFNIPHYHPSVDLLEAMIRKNNCFTIERISQTTDHLNDIPFTAKMISSQTRSVMEGLIEEHFGSENMDRLFDVVTKKIEESPRFNDKDNPTTMSNLLAIIKRKAF